jgi:methionyl aminopeptidase
MIPIRTAEEIASMRRAGDLAGRTLAAVGEHIAPGVSTAALDELAEQFLEAHGGRPSFKGYLGFPRSICASVNDAVVHGIPAKDVTLQQGDIVGIDLGAEVAGLHADVAATFGVGEIEAEAARLLRVTWEACLLGVAAAVAGNHIGDIAQAVQRHVEAAGYAVVRDLVGHGIGRSVHEEPRVPNFFDGEAGAELRPGMALAIEPMVNAGGWRVRVGKDRWTVLTADASLSAHFEHTVIVRRGRPLVVTRWPTACQARQTGRVALGG